MTKGSKPAASTIEKGERAEWKRPEMRRISAGSAEFGPALQTDANNTAS